MPRPGITSTISPAHHFEDNIQFQSEWADAADTSGTSRMVEEMTAIRHQIGTLMDYQGEVLSIVRGFAGIEDFFRNGCDSKTEEKHLTQMVVDPQIASDASYRGRESGPQAYTDCNSGEDSTAIEEFAPASTKTLDSKVIDNQAEATTTPKSRQSKLKLRTGMTQNSFGSVFISEKDDMLMLLRSFELAEQMEMRKLELEISRQQPLHHIWTTLLNMAPHEAEMVIDAVLSVVILLNALFISISMDSDEEFMFIEIVFSIIYLIELVLKCMLNGCGGHFCGPNKISHIFDFLLICLDVFQLAVTSLQDGKGNIEMPSPSLLRIVRLAKLARIIRLMKSPIFNDLLSMIQGMMGGMSTLLWSMVLFVVVIFVVAMVFRELLGRRDKDNITEYFDSVPRSMLTTFRCSFGDCSSASGVPIFEYVNEEYGGGFSLVYCMFVFVITIGLFNVISAIFVESTMEAAAELQYRKKKARLQDEKLWASRSTALIRRLMDMSTDHDCPESLSEAVEIVYEMEFPCTLMAEFAREEDVKIALGELDIDPEDHDKLADILDPDNGGTIKVIEFLDGLTRLRGDPRRSDIVTVDLMVRSLQRDVTLMKRMLEGLSTSSITSAASFVSG